jgi:DNA-damage-inducible protein D
MSELNVAEYKRFEDIKHIRDDKSEYWSARELSTVLEYTQWRNFTKVIDKAMLACKTSGHDVLSDFAEVSKIVEAGATSKPMKDYALSRYACYLIVQNSDPRKEVVALGQTYFAIQTYRQEVADRRKAETRQSCHSRKSELCSLFCWTRSPLCH